MHCNLCSDRIENVTCVNRDFMSKLCLCIKATLQPCSNCIPIHYSSSPAMSIKLYVDPASPLLQEFTDSSSNLQTEVQFKRAVVTTGTWIFYTYPNYNTQEAGGTSSNYKILQPGADEDISSVNGSMYLVMDATEGILLFEHSYYGGTRQV